MTVLASSIVVADESVGESPSRILVLAQHAHAAQASVEVESPVEVDHPDHGVREAESGLR